VKRFLLVAVSLSFVLACKPRRDDAGSDVLAESSGDGQGTLEVPPGLSREETSLYYHWDEGSGVIPLKWLKHIRSVNDNFKTTYLQDMDRKFGALIDRATQAGQTFPALATKDGRPITYVGLTVGWSEEHPLKQDFRMDTSTDQEKKTLMRRHKNRDGETVTSVPLVGVNCSFCHSGAIDVPDANGNRKRVFIEGAPNVLSVRNFFKDMFQSTLATMVDEDRLTEFLGHFKDQELAKKEAHDFALKFRSALGIRSRFRTVNLLRSALAGVDFFASKGKAKVAAFLSTPKGREVLTNALARLFELTHNNEKPSKFMMMRFKWIADSIGGFVHHKTGKRVEEISAGYMRTDAFGRISNLALRGDEPIDLNANVSTPHIWGIKYTAMLQWNANTSSVLMRNAGQSLGLGAIVTNPKTGDSSINMHNLNFLEKSIYKIKVPQWTKFFKTPPKDKIVAGCDVYFGKNLSEVPAKETVTCAGCHENIRRVGPTKQLVDYWLGPADAIAWNMAGMKPTHSVQQITDRQQTINQAVPIKGRRFSETIFEATNGLMERYYQRFNVSPAEQSQWANAQMRGREGFRDTLIGMNYPPLDGSTDYRKLPAKLFGYPAPMLAGIWASPPYLHNGSVPNFRALMNPKVRPARFTVGDRRYDAKNMGYMTQIIRSASECEKLGERCLDTSLTGNKNVGHLWGKDLTTEDVDNLIEFLKVLEPHKEYSWGTKPLYTVQSGKCVAN
jgi:hypothetical protein